MTGSLAHFNLILAWLWICLGFAGGAVMGMFFHDENWMGGYGSHKRRLYRLGHISFFGLAIINLLFFFTVRELDLAGPSIDWASMGFAVGAITMPICCLIMAHRPRLKMLFAVPVISLLMAGLLTFAKLLTL